MVRYQLKLFGPFMMRERDGSEIQIAGAKHRALVAILATATNGTHTRAWIQETLWGRAGEEHGRASLRRALSDLRRIFGHHFEQLFETSNVNIQLKLGHIEIIGSRADGEFLEGIRLHERKFNSWLVDKRVGDTAFGHPAIGHSQRQFVPRIAIVPFVTISGEPIERHFSDMLSLEVSRALSRSSVVEVISHLSSRRFSKRYVELQQIRDTLKINYLVHGTMRINDTTFQLDADFIEIESGTIIWTRKYSGDVRSFLKGDGEVVARIGRDVGQTVLQASIELAETAPLPKIASHAVFLSSILLMHQHRLAQFSRSRVQLEELISRNPSNAYLQAWLAKWYILSISQGWSVDPVKDMSTAADNTQRALDINPTCALSLTIDGMVQGDRNGDMELAELRFHKATEHDPNHALAWLMFSRLKSFCGAGPEAVQYANKAITLSPIDPYGYFFDILGAMAHNVAGDYGTGCKWALRSLQSNPRHTSSYRVLAISQQMMGLGDDARETVKKLLKLDPTLTIEQYRKSHPASMQEIGRQWADALERAGVPCN